MYVGVHYDRVRNKVLTREIKDGVTVQTEYQPEYFFYVEDKNGRHVSTTDRPLSKLSFNDNQTYQNSIRKYKNQGIRTYEADVKVLFKTLEKNFKPSKVPKFNKSYFDIEVAFDKVKGYADPSDPFNPVTAISIYNNWENTLYSLVIPPKHIPLEEAEKMLAHLPNNLVCENETQMFSLFFELTNDSHILSGWNSTMFDVPYMVNRVRKIMGNDAVKNFCLWGYSPVPRTVEKYGKEQQVYDLIGKVHVDMLELYQKYTYSEQPSYSLDYISSIEIGEKKVPYEGSLDQLYNKDFVQFVEYSRQDTRLLEKIDKKRDHINLAFTIAYENLVDIKTVMGSVALSDNAITLEAHRLGKIVPDRFGEKSDDKIPGAYVVNPKVGITPWVGSVDLTSLYPSIFRALNLGNETIVAQVKHTLTRPIIEERMANIVITDEGVRDKKEASFAEAWRDFVTTLEYTEIMNKTDTILQLEINEGETIPMAAKDIYDFIFGNDFILTANATIIRTDKKSVVSSLLERWFNERKLFQARAKVFQDLTVGIKLPEEILKQLEDHNGRK